MRAYNTVYVIILLPGLIQQSGCDSTFPKITMDDQLSDPTYCLTMIDPTAGKGISGKAAFDANPDVRAGGTVG